jgi:hypothetical protein
METSTTVDAPAKKEKIRSSKKERRREDRTEDEE